MKSEIRKEVLNKRNQMTKDELHEKSLLIFEKLRPYLDHARCVGIYKHFGSEVETEEIIHYLLLLEKTVCVPICKKNQKLQFCRIDEDTTFANQFMGIPEPIHAKPVASNDIDLMIIPMVAFYEHQRLGYGKGYYDRYLQTCEAYKIGLAFQCQEIQFEYESFDIPMNIIIYE